MLSTLIFAAILQSATLPDSIVWEPWSGTVNGRTLSGDLGRLRVPANRAAPSGSDIRLAFVRLKATTPTPGTPIVYLAGGPGNSGIDNLRSRQPSRWRPVTVFGFGLLHGLGFAGVLRDLGLPRGQEALALAGFNLGIEGGQLAVLLLAFLAVGWWIRRAWFHARITVPASVAIALVAGLWTIERSLA